jgi:hypothetical protein
MGVAAERAKMELWFEHSYKYCHWAQMELSGWQQNAPLILTKIAVSSSVLFTSATHYLKCMTSSILGCSKSQVSTIKHSEYHVSVN